MLNDQPPPIYRTGAIAPLILHADDKAGTKRPVLGAGDHVYEAYHDWGELPASIQYGNTHGVIEDSQGRIYVHHTVGSTSESSDSMVVFDAQGKFIKSWGKDFKGGAHGLHIRREGSTEFLYLCDTKRGVVVKATLDGEEVFTLGYPDKSEAYKPGADGKPAEVQPDQSGHRAQRRPLCRRRLRIQLHQSIQLQGRVSAHLRRQGQGEPASSIARTASWWTCGPGLPILTVADRANNRIQRFTLAGEHIDFISGTNLPCHFSYSRNGDVVVPDLGARVTLMDRDNR
jgi:hypothetical protein